MEWENQEAKWATQPQYYKMYHIKTLAIISLAITLCFQTQGDQFRIHPKSIFNHKSKLDTKMACIQIKIISQKYEKT